MSFWYQILAGSARREATGFLNYFTSTKSNSMGLYAHEGNFQIIPRSKYIPEGVTNGCRGCGKYLSNPRISKIFYTSEGSINNSRGTVLIKRDNFVIYRGHR